MLLSSLRGKPTLNSMHPGCVSYSPKWSIVSLSTGSRMQVPHVSVTCVMVLYTQEILAMRTGKILL